MRKMIGAGFLILLAAAVLLSLIPGVALAGLPPCIFVGEVQQDGVPVPPGTVVRAWVDGAGPWSVSTYTFYGKARYVITIPPDEDPGPGKTGAHEGDTVYFSVGGRLAEQTGVWHSEGYFMVNLGTWVINLPVANFVAATTIAEVGQDIAFTDLSTGPADQWRWDFNNDGVIDSTQQNPIFSYAATGVYTVSLTARNARGGDTETKVGYIRVFQMAERLYNGWNLITYSGPTMPLLDAIGPIAAFVDTIWWHDNQTKDWLTWSSVLPPFINTLNTLQLWQPYWVNVTANVLWTVGP